MFSVLVGTEPTPVRPELLPQSLIATDLEHVERILSETLHPYQSNFPQLVEHLNHYRGKRLRPMLMLLVARACGSIVTAHHVLGAVVEMVHTATLVHDDVLDEAETRRHVDTVNARWGNKISILLGDLLFTNAFHLSSTLGDARACRWIGEATNRVCAGELRQTLESGNLLLKEADYFAIVEGKTAALTECAARLGAVYAGATNEISERLAGYGRDLGIAFQIADDVLDLVGEESRAGKTLRTDLEQKKLTLPLIYLLEGLPAAQARQVRTWLQEDVGSHIPEILTLLKAEGCIQRAQRCAERYAQRGTEALTVLPPSTARDALRAMVQWSIRRDR